MAFRQLVRRNVLLTRIFLWPTTVVAGLSSVLLLATVLGFEGDPDLVELTVVVLFGLGAVVYVLLNRAFHPYMWLCPRIASWYQIRKQLLEREGVPAYVVELRLRPTLLSDQQKRGDPADDVGLLRLQDGRLRFCGDAVTLDIALSDILAVRVQKEEGGTTWQGRLLTPPREVLVLGTRVANVPFEELRFAVREGYRTSRQRDRQARMNDLFLAHVGDN